MRGSWRSLGASAGNIGRMSYAGALTLPEIGMVHLRARAYAPNLGRFIQPDPIGTAGGINLYAYAGGDPMNAIDPLGLRCTPQPPAPDGTPRERCEVTAPRSTWGDWMNTRIYRPDGRPTTGELFEWKPRHTEALCKVQIEGAVSAEIAMIFGTSSAVTFSLRPATGAGSVGFEQGVLVGFGASLTGEIGGGEIAGRRGAQAPDAQRNPSGGGSAAGSGAFQRFTGGVNVSLAGGGGIAGVQLSQRVLGSNAGTSTVGVARIGPQGGATAGASLEFEANWNETYGKGNCDEAR